MGRRHANVDHRDLGLVCASLADEVLSVPGLRHNLKPCVNQKACDPFAQKDRVFADDYPHGISARTIIGAPADW